MGRSLQRSNVMKILSVRRFSTTYPSALMNGAKAFQAELLKLWREDEERDYLTGKTSKELRSRQHAMNSPATKGAWSRRKNAGFAKSFEGSAKRVDGASLEVEARKSKVSTFRPPRTPISLREIDSDDVLVGSLTPSSCSTPVFLDGDALSSRTPLQSLPVATKRAIGSGIGSSDRISRASPAVSHSGSYKMSSVEQKRRNSSLGLRSADIASMRSFLDMQGSRLSGALGEETIKRFKRFLVSTTSVDTVGEGSEDTRQSNANVDGFKATSSKSVKGPNLAIDAIDGVGSPEVSSKPSSTRRLYDTADLSRSRSSRKLGKNRQERAKVSKEGGEENEDMLSAPNSERERSASERIAEMPPTKSSFVKKHELEDEENERFRRGRVRGNSVSESVALLTKGAEFVKHGRRGNPHLRFVWMQRKSHASLDCIRWCEVEKFQRERARVSTSSKRSIRLQDISTIRLGCQTDIFRRSKSSLVDAAAAERCFSLVTPHRTLDVAASSAAVRDAWVSALQRLLSH